MQEVRLPRTQQKFV